MTKKLIIGFAANCFWALVAMQRLCLDKPPNDRDTVACCPRLPSPVDAGIVEACVYNYSRNTQRQLQETKDGVPKGSCISECLTNLTKIYRGNGLIDKVTLKRIFMNTVSGDRVWGDIVASSVDLCVNETRIKADELRQGAMMKATFAGEIICNPISGYVLGCINTELFRRCPDPTDSSECSDLRNYTMYCQVPPKYNEIN